MKPTRTKTAATPHRVPQSRTECTDMVAEIGQHGRELARIEAAMNDELAEIKERYEEQARPHREAIQSTTDGVRIWCEANRIVLTDNGKTKTVNLSSGVVKWRLTPPKVDIKRGMTAAALSAIRAAGLADAFLRVSEELNKEAVLAAPEKVKGIAGLTVKQTEEFVVEPYAEELASA